MILNAKNLMRKTSRNIFSGHLDPGGLFLIFSQGCTQSCGEGGRMVALMPFKIFCGSCYSIQFKPYATSKVELFVKKNR